MSTLYSLSLCIFGLSGDGMKSVPNRGFRTRWASQNNILFSVA